MTQIYAPNSFLPDRIKTPGAVSRLVTVREVKQSFFSMARRRPMATRKHGVFISYGIDPVLWQDYVLDHLVPLSLGGTNSHWNLWPMPLRGTWPGALKGQVERALLERVRNCALPLIVAQRLLCTNWAAVYSRVFLDEADLSILIADTLYQPLIVDE